MDITGLGTTLKQAPDLLFPPKGCDSFLDFPLPIHPKVVTLWNLTLLWRSSAFRLFTLWGPWAFVSVRTKFLGRPFGLPSLFACFSGFSFSLHIWLNSLSVLFKTERQKKGRRVCVFNSFFLVVHSWRVDPNNLAHRYWKQENYLQKSCFFTLKIEKLWSHFQGSSTPPSYWSFLGILLCDLCSKTDLYDEEWRKKETEIWIAMIVN